MKRKRQISKEISYKDNDNTGLKLQSLSGNQTIDQRNIQPSNQNTPLQRSCLTSLSCKQKYVHRRISAKRKCLQRRKKIPVLRDITNFSETHFSEVDNAQEGLCTRTPKTPSYKRRRVLGVSLDSNQSTKTTEKRTKDQRSTETNTTHVPNKRKQRQNKISVGYDIPNIDQLHDDHIEDDLEEMNDCDVDIEGIIEEIDADLEFDVSSQETTDSENDDLGVDVSNANITYPFRQEVKRKTKPLRKSSICKSRGSDDALRIVGM
ncbi:hypothetical protein YC2023_111265 [Brassica napus]